MDPEAILSFCAVTGAEAHVATEYLQVADSSVEQAISLFYENGSQPLQSRDTSGTGAGAARTTADTEVRSPIAARRDVLVDDYSGEDGMGYAGAFMPPYAGPVQERVREARSIFDQQPGAGRVPFRDFAQEAAEMTEGDSGSSAVSSRRSRLADLFKPPFDLMHPGDLNSARSEGVREGRWVLVNLQQVAEFRCQALNRDVWSQDVIRELVRRNFVFLQLPTDNPEGSRVATMYNADSYPFVAAIHPKTGELRARFTRFGSAVDVVEDLTNFSLDNPLPSRRNPAAGADAAAAGAGAARTPAANSVYNLTEEEQLAAAIAASELGNGLAIVDSDEEIGSSDEADSYSDIQTIDSDDDGADDSNDDDGDDDNDDDDSDDDGMDVDGASLAHEQMASQAAAEAAGPDAWYRQLPANEPPEPAAGPAATRIQLRFPHGRPVVRRFALADRVAAIFQYLKATVPGAADSVPEVLFLGRRLAERVTQTIEEAGLANASVVVDV
ncbi:UBX domain protein Ubx2 [Coemansia biformis]|uniref:UBX domain protein Ubx2 n=1 Tax=Coemansia biformis TaxID=1286918 RepID=A0A9W7YAI7_9FUNG|nr:UBX domain protein Ubx2 [Coemansia biformis]